MILLELRVLSLYQRLWRENRLLLSLLRGGYTLAEAERILAESAPRDAPPAPVGRVARQGGRRVVI